MSLKVAFLSTFARQIVVMVVGLATVSTISRVLGSEEFGSYAVAIAFVSLAQSVAVLSVPSVVIHFYSKVSDPSQLFSCGFFLALSALCVVSIVSLVFYYLGIFFLPNVSLNASLWILSLLWFHVLNNLFESSFLATREYRYFNLLQAAVPVVFFALCTFFLDKGDRWIDALRLANAASILAMPFYFYLSRKKIKLVFPEFNRFPFRKYVGYGAHVWLANLVTMALYRAPIFVAEKICLPKEVGLYALANNFAEKVWVPGKAVATILFPERSSNQGDGGIKLKSIYKLVFANMIMALFGMATLSLFFYFYGTFFFGSQDKSLYMVSLALTPGIVAWSGVNILGAELAGLGLSKVNFYASLLAFTASLIGSLTFAKNGAFGIAIGASIGYVVGFILSFYFYKKSSSPRTL